MKTGSSRSGAVTLADVAAAAGVDRSTVSRALRDEAHRVSPATIARVHAVAAELGYRPHHAAATLRSGHSRMLGVLVPTITDAAMAALFAGIEDAARVAGYLAVVTSTGSDDAVRLGALETYRGRSVDGLLLADSLIGQPCPVNGMFGRLPVVSVFRQGPPDHPSVVADEYAGGQAVAEHLLDQGHRDIVVLGTPDRIPTFHDRIAGLCDGVHTRLGAAGSVRVVRTGLQVDDGYAAMSRVLAEGPPPTGVFAINDYSAIGAAHALLEHDLTPGADVALVGYNDDPIAAHLPVPLSSVRIDVGELGRRGARALIGMIEGRTVDLPPLPPRLVVRASSLVAAEDIRRRVG
ncbi:LacI family DNA-binding transcriptional regulator [Pseudonocardia spinosispora]|uniref:LacI family DNA-binding transcriptional regulator n=1 Tax=Pseudonocardia spinosispora TaxID=103441 RepID=UPI0003FDB616|nr:LacI family DNA-binding transcriptional regulator [Pseudonocardia spinosispora]